MNDDTSKFLTQEQVAKLLQVSTKTVQRRLKHLKARKLGRLSRYFQSDVEEYLCRQSKGSRADSLPAELPSPPDSAKDSGSRVAKCRIARTTAKLARDELNDLLTSLSPRKRKGGQRARK